MENPHAASRKLAVGFGYCIASARIAVERAKVGFAYREEPSDDQDSGWRFFSGDEPDEYCEDPDNFKIYDLNTIANIDDAITLLMEKPVGTAFDRQAGGTWSTAPFPPV